MKEVKNVVYFFFFLLCSDCNKQLQNAMNHRMLYVLPLSIIYNYFLNLRFAIINVYILKLLDFFKERPS